MAGIIPTFLMRAQTSSFFIDQNPYTGLQARPPTADQSAYTGSLTSACGSLIITTREQHVQRG